MVTSLDTMLKILRPVGQLPKEVKIDIDKVVNSSTANRKGSNIILLGSVV